MGGVGGLLESAARCKMGGANAATPSKRLDASAGRLLLAAAEAKREHKDSIVDRSEEVGVAPRVQWGPGVSSIPMFATPQPSRSGASTHVFRARAPDRHRLEGRAPIF